MICSCRSHQFVQLGAWTRVEIYEFEWCLFSLQRDRLDIQNLSRMLCDVLSLLARAAYLSACRLQGARVGRFAELVSRDIPR